MKKVAMEESIPSEQALWAAVIAQAMMDAKSTNMADYMRFEKRAALRWLEEDKRDFAMVCDLAGLHPDRVRVKARETLGEDIVSRPLPVNKGTGHNRVKRYLMKAKMRKAGQP